MASNILDVDLKIQTSLIWVISKWNKEKKKIN